MNYVVTKVVGKVVAKPGINQNKKYAVLTIVSEDKQVQKEICVFDREADKYLKYCSVANGGTAQIDTPIPEDEALLTFVMDDEFKFPEPMVRVGADGKPMLNKFNQPYVRESVRITTRYYRDEQRAMLGLPVLAPLSGWDLASRGTSVMNAFYIPLREINQASAGVSAPTAGDDSPVG